MNYTKLAASVIGSHLTNLFNHCIETGTYPDALKTAEVIPVHKLSDKLPVAILGLFLLFHHFQRYLKSVSISSYIITL